MDDAEILAAALAIVRRMQTGAQAPPAPTLTLRQLYGHYVPYRSKIGGWRVVQGRLRSVMDSVYAEGIPPLGDRDVMSIRLLDWSDWRAWRSGQEYAPGKTPSDHTVNLHLESLKAMLNWGVSEGRIPHNPIAAARHVGKRGKRQVAPTEEEISLLLDDANDRERYIILASNDAGMRLNELRQCKHEWVDAEHGRIHLAAEVCKGKKARTVPATNRLLDAISSLPRHFRSPYILTKPNTGEPYCAHAIARWFKAKARAAGLPHLVLHDGRHHFASASLERGIDIDTVRKQMGHSRLSTTETYIQTRTDATFGPALEAFEAGIAAELRKNRHNSDDREKSKR